MIANPIPDSLWGPLIFYTLQYIDFGKKLGPQKLSLSPSNRVVQFKSKHTLAHVIYSAGILSIPLDGFMTNYNRGSHTTSESAFILREWARGKARLVVWWRGTFILFLRRWRRILHSPFSENVNLIFRSRLSPLRSCALSSLRFFCYLRLLVAAGIISRFSKYFSEIHSPCHKKPQRGVTTLPWITSPENPQQLFILREIFILRGRVTTPNVNFLGLNFRSHHSILVVLDPVLFLFLEFKALISNHWYASAQDRSPLILLALLDFSIQTHLISLRRGSKITHAVMRCRRAYMLLSLICLNLHTTGDNYKFMLYDESSLDSFASTSSLYSSIPVS